MTPIPYYTFKLINMNWIHSPSVPTLS